MKRLLFLFLILTCAPLFSAEIPKLDPEIEKHIDDVIASITIEKNMAEYAKIGNWDKVKQLIEQGQDVNCRTKNGATTLHFACLDCHDDIVQLLLEKKADANIRTKDGYSVLHAIANTKSVSFDKTKKIMYYLMQNRNIDINAQDNVGFTPLTYAIARGDFELVHFLVTKEHADISGWRRNLTPLDIANIANIALLANANADYKRIATFLRQQEMMKADDGVVIGSFIKSHL